MKINSRYLFIYFGIFIQVVVIQFSTHHYETLDWDINAFLVTSLEFGRVICLMSFNMKINHHYYF